MRSSLPYILLAVLCGAAIVECAEKVLLKNVKTITLNKGKMTKGRRLPGQPQLQCVGGAARGQFEPRTVQCYNRGHDGVDVQWECRADMSDEYQFGEIAVSCEGYDHPDDPYVLVGSCGLEYELDYSASGKKNYNYFPESKSEGVSQIEDWITKGVTFLVIAFIVYMFYVTIFGSTTGTEGDRERRGGGLGGDDNHGHPPSPGWRPSGAPPSYDDATKAKHSSTSSSSSSGPGFWTGTGLGAAAGYMAGRAGQSTSTNTRRRSSPPAEYARNTGFDNSQADQMPSTSTHESVGFGGTRRR